MEDFTNFLNGNSFINKTVLSISKNKTVTKYWESNPSKLLYLYPKELAIKYKNNKTKSFELKNCGKIFEKLDTILIDLNCNDEKEFRTLKCILEVLLNGKINPKTEIIVIKKENSEISIYQDLLVRFWEGLIKFKNLFSLSPNIKYINLNS